MEVDQKLKRWLERFTEWRRRRALAREHWWAERHDVDLSEFQPPLLPDDIIEARQEMNKRRRSRLARERLYGTVEHDHPKEKPILVSPIRARPGESQQEAIERAYGRTLIDLEEENRRLQEALAAMEKPRSIAARINLLFEHLTDESGEPFTNEKVAERSRGRLTAPKVAQLRNGSAEKFSLFDLTAISGAFNIDFYKYWTSIEKAPLEELDSDVAEQRQLLQDYPGWSRLDVLKNDLRAYMAEQDATYEEIAEEVGGTIHPRHLEAVLEDKTKLYDFKVYKALAQMMGREKDLSEVAWRERYLGSGMLGHLEP